MSATSRQISIRGDGVGLAADRWDPPSLTPEGVVLTSKGVVLLLHGGGQTLP